MSTLVLSVYVLIWPVVVAAVLFVIGRAFVTEWRDARREGRDII
jgi:hypothetical protein